MTTITVHEMKNKMDFPTNTNFNFKAIMCSDCGDVLYISTANAQKEIIAHLRCIVIIRLIARAMAIKSRTSAMGACRPKKKKQQ